MSLHKGEKNTRKFGALETEVLAAIGAIDNNIFDVAALLN